MNAYLSGGGAQGAGGDRRALPFLKGHGTGNDFVVLPDADGALDLTPDLVRRLCDRRFGIGGDGVLRVVRAEHVPDAANSGAARWFMDYHNADGSVAEMCGNGVRVYARFLVDAGWEQAGEFELATRGGIKGVHVPQKGDIRVDMGAPQLQPDPQDARLGSATYRGSAISMGNPHLVVRLDDAADLHGLDLTQDVTVAPEAFPTGVNLEFYVETEADGPGGLEMRVHERGVGETLSCGTGACAVAAAAAGAPGTARPVRVPGGLLSVEWTPETLFLSGPAELVAEGVWYG